MYKLDKECEWVKVIDYLLGNRELRDTPLTRQNKRIMQDETPIQSSPFMYYLKQVNRFLFSGGLSINIPNELDDDPRRDFLKSFWTMNLLEAKLFSILERASVTGELLAVPSYNPEIGYFLNFYEKAEFKWDNGRYIILTIKEERGKKYYYRFDIDNVNYYHYQLVDINEGSRIKWTPARVEEHGYGTVPACVIQNTAGIDNSRGKTDFDLVAVEIACQMLLQFGAASENFYFYGQPTFVSPDPEDTLKRLQNRVRVLTKLPGEDGGGVDMLERAGMPKQQGDHIEMLQENLYRHLGMSPNAEVQNGGVDVSSLTLRMLNEDTISVAESKWSLYVSAGLDKLLNLVLHLGIMDGVLPVATSDEHVWLTRRRPYFSIATNERLQLADLAVRYIDFGIERVKALHLTVFPEMEEEQIDALLTSDMAVAKEIGQDHRVRKDRV